MENTTLLGNGGVLAGVTIAAVLLLLVLRRWRTASCVTAAALVCLCCNEAVKPLVGRDRPNVSWRFVELPASASFPSGHALGSMTVYGSLALTVGVRLRRRTASVLVIAAGLSLALLIGFTRVYLGVHYLSDVLAGWGIGLTLAMLACWADWRWRRKLVIVDAASGEPGAEAP
jgi:undecaprenyl-diphosphatase